MYTREQIREICTTYPMFTKEEFEALPQEEKENFKKTKKYLTVYNSIEELIGEELDECLPIIGQCSTN